MHSGAGGFQFFGEAPREAKRELMFNVGVELAVPGEGDQDSFHAAENIPAMDV